MSVSLRSQLQYRASMVMQSVGHLLVTGIEFFGVWALFERFGHLQGWTLAEAAVFYGCVNASFAIADAGSRGFDTFDQMVKRGDFDRVLLRPRSTALQIAARELTIKRVGRFLQGAVVLGWGMHSLGLPLTPARVVLLALIGAGTVALFYGLTILRATLAFWTTESLEIMAIATYGGVETAQYPLSIYREGFRRFFIFVIPIGCVTYFPIVALLDKADPLGSPSWFQWAAPLTGLMFLAVALRLWRAGVRRYTSTGS